MAVRPVERGDFDRWLPLWDGYNAFYGRSGPTALPREVTDVTWARFSAADEPVYALVAEADGELVGFTHFLLHRSTTAIAPSCYLQDLFTAPAARGRGAGRALISAVADRARTAGAARLYWHTHETNRTARRLYDEVAELTGFVVYSHPLG
ncbi:GNAT family N-acetyltransferase [Pseudonocardia sp. S2-4]|uniref:GNAT family N-acetyltransferase n=1 Tax=Pseudonocardia humida TaxID=2800819 RepID=A0ABT1A1A5_9PSEU|nr:GNAT family N-acetyltransferase [Pseudonocardia humida]